MAETTAEAEAEEGTNESAEGGEEEEEEQVDGNQKLVNSWAPAPQNSSNTFGVKVVDMGRPE